MVYWVGSNVQFLKLVLKILQSHDVRQILSSDILLSFAGIYSIPVHEDPTLLLPLLRLRPCTHLHCTSSNPSYCNSRRAEKFIGKDKRWNLVQLCDITQLRESSECYRMSSVLRKLHTAGFIVCFFLRLCDCWLFWSSYGKSTRNESEMGKVGEWKASYYRNDTKTWIYGQFMIYTRCIRFIEDKGGTSGLDFRIFFEDFFELRKETTLIFFAAITIRVKTDKYWFSSFTDRGHVFNTIELFWKERLCARYVKFRLVAILRKCRQGEGEGGGLGDLGTGGLIGKSSVHKKLSTTTLIYDSQNVITLKVLVKTQEYTVL